jgi:glutathione S-transferase
MPNTSSAPAALEVRRTFAAARPRVFAAWTSAEALKRWHAPPDAEVEDAGVDFRVGGRYHVVIRGQDGTRHHVTGQYREIDEPRRIVLTWRWESAPDSHESTVTVDFIERAGETDVVLTHHGLRTDQERDGHRHGWVGCLDKLAGVL